MSDINDFLEREKNAREEAEQQGTEQAYKDAYQQTISDDVKTKEEAITTARESGEQQEEAIQQIGDITWENVNVGFYEGLESITDSPFGELMNGVIFAAMETARLTAEEMMPILEKALDAGIEASGYAQTVQAASSDYLKQHLDANTSEAGTTAERSTGVTGAGI